MSEKNRDENTPDEVVTTGRRTFIKGSAIAAAAGVLGAAVMTPSRAEDHGAASATDYDVVVVGGGFAGATAARELGQAGYRVLLLEARSRLGGRTFTTEFAGKQIELGGTWVHWHQPYVWAEMHRYNLGVVESPVAEPTTGIVLTGKGERQEHDPLALYGSMDEAFTRLFHDSLEHFPRPYDPLFRDSVKKLDQQSVTERMNATGIPADQQEIMTGIFGGMIGLDMDAAGAAAIMKVYAACGWNFTAFMDAQSRYKIEGGTIALVEALLRDSGADVRLSTPVVELAQQAERVKVVTDDDEVITARAAVVTIPRNVYPAIEFDPPLSAGKQALAQQDHQARGIKVYAHLADDVGQILAAGAVSNPLCFLQTEHHGPEGSIVIGFGGSRDLLDINDGEAVAAEIRRYLPDSTVLATTTYDWLYDPFSRGAWPAYRKGVMSGALETMQASEGRFFFAGAATASGWHEWIDGAIESGIRAGREVREALA